MELNRKNIKKILFIVIVAVVFFWALNNIALISGAIGKVMSVISPLITGLCLAFVINVLLRPIENLWDKATTKAKANIIKKLKRPVCMVVSILLILGVIFIVLFMVIPQISKTVAAIAAKIPDFVKQAEVWWGELSVFLAQYAVVLPEMSPDFNESLSQIAKYLTEIAPDFINITVNFTGSIFNALFNLVIAFAFSIYVLAKKESLGRNISRALNAFLPKNRVERVVEVAALSSKTFSNFVTGQLTEAVIIGVLCFIVMLIFNIPYATVISVLIGFTALIPVFGAYFGTIVGAVLIAIASPIKAVWFVIAIIILQQLEGNLIYPKVVGKSVGLPGILVLAAVTVGGGLFGVAGMLISVPLVSVLYTLFKQAVDKRLKAKAEIK